MLRNQKKRTAIALATTCFWALSTTANAKIGLTQEFINGFETGIFVRDDENAFSDYSCDKPSEDTDLRK